MPNFLKPSTINFHSCKLLCEKVPMELETMKIVVSLHIFAVLSEFCNYSQRIQGIKSMKSSDSEHIAHFDCVVIEHG